MPHKFYSKFIDSKNQFCLCYSSSFNLAPYLCNGIAMAGLNAEIK